MDDSYSHVKLVDGTSIFINYWIFAEPLAGYVSQKYDMSILPGSKEDLSAASISGFNVGINNLLEEENTDDLQNSDVTNKEKLDAAVRVIKFISSKEIQKIFFMKGASVAAMPPLFDDIEVCKVKNCEMYKNMQPLMVRSTDMCNGKFEKNEYESKFRKYALKYIYEDNVDLDETLKSIEDIIKIHYISLDKTDTSIGYIAIIIIFIISLLMIFSLVFLFFENFQPFFKFLSLDSWILLIIGLILILWTILTYIGQITSIKCCLRVILFDIGLTLYLVNILYELISNINEEIKICIWIKNHKYLFILFFLFIDFGLNTLITMFPYDVKDRIIDDGENFQICKMKNAYGKFILYLIIINKLFFLLVILFFIFLEWNLKKIFYEVRFIVLAIYSNFLLLFMIFLVDVSHINSYITYFYIYACIIFFISLSSYLFLYGYKLCLAFLRKKNIKLLYINSINKSFINDSDYSKSKSETRKENVGFESEYCNSYIDANNDNINTNTENKDNKDTLFSRLIDIHYSTGEADDEDEIITKRQSTIN